MGKFTKAGCLCSAYFRCLLVTFDNSQLVSYSVGLFLKGRIGINQAGCQFPPSCGPAESATVIKTQTTEANQSCENDIWENTRKLGHKWVEN
jgi:hypothetical protein